MSVCHKSVFRRNDWTDRAGFGMEAPVHICCTMCYKEIQISTKIRVLPSGSLFKTPDFRTFRHGTSIVATCCQHSSTKMDAQRDKLDRRQSAEAVFTAD